MARFLLVGLLAGLALPAGARAAAPAACPGDPIRTDRIVTGSFPAARQGAYVMVPFAVPAGTTAVRVKYCWDLPPAAARGERHTLDLGLWSPAPRGRGWGIRQFRGWGGSSHPDVTVSPRGFSSERRYLADPKGDVPGRTTRGFEPGAIPPGRWAAELGVAAVVPPAEGDPDGVAWRIELAFSRARVARADRYRPARYVARPARRGPGWYAGDLHVHAEHSALGDATNRETVDYAFGRAGLDFIALSDYVTDSNWSEIGRVQRRHRRRLVMRSSEVITYRGHLMNHVGHAYVDHRTGPVYELVRGGRLVRRRRARPARAVLGAIHAAGGFTQVNHPTIYPSSDPGFRRLCRGCPWDFSDRATGWARNVDALEVVDGPAALGQTPNPFVLTGLELYERLLARGAHVAAVGDSDSHHAGRTTNPTQTPVGQARTVLYADELSERGVQRAVEWGHTYAKFFGAPSADLRLTARAPGSRGPAATFGDTVAGPRARFRLEVVGARLGSTLLVLRDGRSWRSVPVRGERFGHRFAAAGPGRYELRVVRGALIDTVATPVWVGLTRPLAVRLRAPRRVARRMRVRCAVTGTDARQCALVLRIGGRNVAAGGRLLTAGRVDVRLRVPRAALRRRGRAVLFATAIDRLGAARVVRRRLRR